MNSDEMLVTNSYQAFASVYDELMCDVPYDAWTERIDRDIKKYGISKTKTERTRDLESEEARLESERRLGMDLGCGTGIVTRKLHDMGYDIFGIDYSPEMLSRAMESDEDRGIMYLNQDMRELDLYSTIGTAVSICDSINYLLEDEDVITTFKLVNNYLDPSGLFIFDFNTIHKYRDVIGDSTIAESGEDASFIWSNYYDEESNINEYEVNFFVPVSTEQGNPENLYKKFEEYHYQRGFTLDEMKEFLKEAGLIFVDAFDSESFGEVTEDSERIFVVAKENGK